jgi:DNA (cytosine-5)-methyltransferase 1
MSKYGVPQKRVRFVLIATRNGSDPLFPENLKECKTLKDYIKKLPQINAGEKSNDLPLHRSASISENNLKRLQKTPHNGGTRLAWKDDPDLQINAYKDKDNIFKDVYGRMKWEEPAPTITTRFNSISNGRFGHPEQDRALSLLEGALLQTFSEKYYFSGNTDSIIARQIGNAVPPLFASQIAVKIAEHYLGVF